jgi:hypothetical protein
MNDIIVGSLISNCLYTYQQKNKGTLLININYFLTILMLWVFGVLLM